MYAQPITLLHPASGTAQRILCAERTVVAVAVPREHVWREAQTPAPAPIYASRWLDARTTARIERSVTPDDRYLIGVALRRVRIRIGRVLETIFNGDMLAGTVHVAAPGQAVEAEIRSPCDFIHCHVAKQVINEYRIGARSDSLADQDSETERRTFSNPLIRDELAGSLSHTLTEDFGGGNPGYVDSVARTILIRLIATRANATRVGALSKWRLRLVTEYVTENLAEPISFADLAEIAGLSRMHFAARFRAATGCRPHDYVLQQRIERAKQIIYGTDTRLVDVAMSVGFETQSHSTTIFKRLTRTTPARWRQDRQSCEHDSDPAPSDAVGLSRFRPRNAVRRPAGACDPAKRLVNAEDRPDIRRHSLSIADQTREPGR